MSDHTCPAWAGGLLASPLRRLLQNPEKLLRPHVKPGMRALDLGPGMGFFSLPLARLVGETGRVFCVDLQDQMIAGLRRRAERAGLAARIETRVCTPTSLRIDDLSGTIDFVLAFAMVHEVRDQDRLFAEIRAALQPGGRVLVCEPVGHVTANAFAATVARACAAGFAAVGNPRAALSRCVVLAPA